MTPDWLSAADWERSQAQLPIACVDAVPIHMAGEQVVGVGLILRTTPHQGRRWCFVGGRVRRGERLLAALDREWSTVFGESCPRGPVLGAPIVAEYLPDDIPGRPHDPRKHAISVTYAVAADGEPATVGGEAEQFAWFAPDDVTADLMGFGQETLVPALVNVVMASIR